MNKIRILFIIFVLAHWSFSTLSLFAQNRFDQICVPPQETNRGLATLATYPYYPANATLKSLVIFVKFSDDNFDQSPIRWSAFLFGNLGRDYFLPVAGA